MKENACQGNYWKPSYLAKWRAVLGQVVEFLLRLGHFIEGGIVLSENGSSSGGKVID